MARFFAPSSRPAWCWPFPMAVAARSAGIRKCALPSCGGCALRMPKRSGLNSGAAISRTWWRACAAVGAIPSRRQPASPRCAARCSGVDRSRAGAGRNRGRRGGAWQPLRHHRLAAGTGSLAVRGSAPLPALALLPPPDLSALPARIEHLPFSLGFAPVAGAVAYRSRVLSQPGMAASDSELMAGDPLARGAAELPDGRYRLLVRAVTGTAWKASMPSARSSSMRARNHRSRRCRSRTPS